jgi:hypothetical protein
MYHKQRTRSVHIKCATRAVFKCELWEVCELVYVCVVLVGQ